MSSSVPLPSARPDWKVASSSASSSGWKMTTREKVSLGFSAFDDAINVFSSLYDGRSQASSYQFQARMAQENSKVILQEAQDIAIAGNEELNIMREQGYRQRGEQITAMGASGFDVASESYQDYISETDRQIENNAATIRYNTMSAISSKQYEARLQEIQGELYKKSAKISKSMGKKMAWGSAISSVAKIGAMAYF